MAYWPLIAIATEEEQITFTGDKEKGWGNISFIGRFSNDSVLKYCNINHGDGREEIPGRGEFEAYFSSLSRGGGVLFHKSEATVEECRIIHNKADWGGGVYIDDSTPKLRDNLITENEARWSMGGVEWLISRFSTPEQYKIKQDKIIDIIKGNEVRKNKVDLTENKDGSGTYLIQNQTN